MSSHSFDIELAVKLGDPNLAILVNHFQYWINLNKRLKRNFIDGRTWMYQTRNEIAAHFPYWSPDQIRRMTDKLVDLGILIKGNYNKHGFDKTIWYAFKNEEIFTNDGFAKHPKEEEKEEPKNDETNDIEKQKNKKNEEINTTEDFSSHFGDFATPIPYTIPDIDIDIITTTTTLPPPPSSQCPIGGGGGLKNSFSFEYLNTDGKSCEIHTEEIYRYFIRLPFAHEILRLAIDEAKNSKSLIRNIFTYIKGICERMTKEITKNQEKPKIAESTPEGKKELTIQEKNNLIKAQYEEKRKSYKNLADCLGIPRIQNA